MAVFEKRPMRYFVNCANGSEKSGGDICEPQIYDEYIGKFKNQFTILWGIGMSASCLKMWKEYLGRFSIVVGINAASDEGGQIYNRDGRLSDTAFLQGIINEWGSPDIVLHEADNLMELAYDEWYYLYSNMSSNGVCVLKSGYRGNNETDENTSNYGASFVERCKDIIDYLNARWNGLPATFSESLFSITYSNDSIIFEKSRLSEDAVHLIRIPVHPNPIAVIFKKALKKVGLFDTVKALYIKLYAKLKRL